MHIYIDEAGAFIPPQGRRRYSLVLGLVVPSAAIAELSYQFLRLRDGWPQQAIEIKGSKLNEDQAAQTLELLAAHGAIAEYYGIDMALHPDNVVDEFKERQAGAITVNLTPEHAEAVAQHAHTHAETIRKLANPLFLQAFISIYLTLDMLDVCINYFAQRRPEELGRFAWTIDAKDHTVTRMERLWSTLMLPIGESRSAQQPYSRVKGFNYTHFAKYEIHEATTGDENMRAHLRWMRRTLPFSNAPSSPLRGIDKRIWTEERAFADSKDNLGLQLADIVATCLCRALNGNLRQEGWEPISRLLIRKRTPPFLQLGRAAGQHPPLEPHAAKVWGILNTKSQPMVLETGR